MHHIRVLQSPFSTQEQLQKENLLHLLNRLLIVSGIIVDFNSLGPSRVLQASQNLYMYIPVLKAGLYGVLVHGAVVCPRAVILLFLLKVLQAAFSVSFKPLY